MLATVALHLCFADVGWFERDEAYLIVGLVVGLATVAPAFAGWMRWRTRVSIAVVVLCVLRVLLLLNTAVATFNVFQNPYQLGRFLADAYPGRGSPSTTSAG